MNQQYKEFIESKIIKVENFGFEARNITSTLFPHQKDVVRWAAYGGRRAIFCSFGLGKTALQIELALQVIKHTGKPFLIGLPLGVLGEFKDDAKDLFGITIHYVRDMEEVYAIEEPAIFVSNYERIREGKFVPSYFGGVSFDEGDAIRNLDTKTTDYIIREMSQVPYRFIATATPAPNEYTEILNYAHFLGISDRGQALTKFFQRDSTKAGNLTLYPHKEKEFWLWVRSWGIFIEHPSDLGYNYEGYDLPELKVHFHEVKVRDRKEIVDRDGNYQLYADASKGLSEAAKEKRASLEARVKKAVELVLNKSDKHWLIWHDLEDERKAIEKIVPEAQSVFGSQSNEKKEQLLNDFKHGKFRYLATKPQIAGAGCNFQKHCHNAVFVGIGYKFKDFIQAIYRILRFRQANEVNIHLVYTDAERDILKNLLRKWEDYKTMIKEMTELMKKYGLSQEDAIAELKRDANIVRQEAKGNSFHYINNDCVEETKTMESNSVGMVLTSIPFSDQYEYAESYLDFGHNDGNNGFWKQMDYLIPELYRVLQPGRIAAIHVKNRIIFSYQNGVGFSSMSDFRGETVVAFKKHGFHQLGEHYIATDVVRENAQTYRLGWSENCKDSTKMGSGLPEYLLIFRKPPTDNSNAYADMPVKKDKKEYSRARWQVDAHGHWNSSGNRLLTPKELRSMDMKRITRWWADYCANNPYDYETHVELCEQLDQLGKLPSGFMVTPPKSKSDLVWDDVNRMHTLNAQQARKKQEYHLCPFQIDVVDRAIDRYSNKGDIIFDPFAGIGSVPYRCITKDRYGIGIELNTGYWKDGVAYCKEAEYKKSIPTLFDCLEDRKEVAI